MKVTKIILIILCALTIPLAIVELRRTSCYIDISRIDIEGYPVYTLYKNGWPFASASSKTRAESYMRRYCEN